MQSCSVHRSRLLFFPATSCTGYYFPRLCTNSPAAVATTSIHGSLYLSSLWVAVIYNIIYSDVHYAFLRVYRTTLARNWKKLWLLSFGRNPRCTNIIDAPHSYIINYGNPGYPVWCMVIWRICSGRMTDRTVIILFCSSLSCLFRLHSSLITYLGKLVTSAHTLQQLLTRNKQLYMHIYRWLIWIKNIKL